jgi:hypothetical protein
MIILDVILFFIKIMRLKSLYLWFCIITSLHLLCAGIAAWFNRDGLFMQDEISFGTDAFSNFMWMFRDNLMFVSPVLLIGTVVFLYRKKKIPQYSQ